MSNTAQLLAVLNTTNLQKNDPRLYQVLMNLCQNLLAAERALETTVVTPTSGAFVTSNIGGTASTISMFTTSHNIEDVSAAAVSSALDLL